MEVEQAGRTVLNKVDEQRESAASKLDSAAARMHQAAETGGQRVAGTVHSAAEGIESTADYLRAHDTKRVIADLGNVVRSHPARSLLIAAGVGFLAGRIFRNN